MPSMTLQEFQEQATRLHRRYPHAYPYRKQVELAWAVYGRPLEWFKTRVDYVIRSGRPDYDWVGAAKSVATVVLFDESSRFESLPLEMKSLAPELVNKTPPEFFDAFRIPPEALDNSGTSGSLEALLEREKATSAVDLLMNRWKSKEHADEK